MKNRLQAVQLLLNENSNVGIQDGDGISNFFFVHYTPLHWAASLKNKEICKFLLEFGADPYQEDYEIFSFFFKNGVSPYFLAERYDPEIAKLMKQYKADPDDDEGPEGGCTFFGFCRVHPGKDDALLSKKKKSKTDENELTDI